MVKGNAYHDASSAGAKTAPAVIDERERSERIKAEIRIRAGSLGALARRHDYDRTAISIALKKPWPDVEKIIANLLGVSPRELWPERYPASPKESRRAG